MVKRRGGVLPLGDGRVGVPLTELPDPDWLERFRRAAREHRDTDERWQHAIDVLSTDTVADVPHLVFMIGEVKPADFVMSYFGVVDQAAETANG